VALDKKEFFEKRQMGNKEVMVAIKPMTKEQAREAYPYRRRSKYSESYFGGNDLCDDFCLLVNELAIRCIMCQAPTRKIFLEDGICPDCDGRSELNGTDPHEK